MNRRTVLLVNPNRMLPPIAPIGLEYVAAELERAGYDPILCDLQFAEDWATALTQAIGDVAPIAIGVSVRNIDDAYFASQDFILETTAAMIRHVQSTTDAPVILGGVGFSCAPREILEHTGANFGIAGEGEQSFPLLLQRVSAGTEVSDVPGAVFRDGRGRVVMTPPAPWDLSSMPAPSRRLVDNRGYFAEGGQAGIETKRGCSNPCIYCVDPVAKGASVRLRSPDSIANEYRELLELGIDVVHLCDSEFNVPAEHAHAVCEAFVHSGIASKVKWYTYAAPQPFDESLAQAMARAGCVGINFGVDHADPVMLSNLGRDYTTDDLRRTVQACRNTGIACMFDLLLGGPGESHETIATAIEFMREVNPDCVGLSCGVRIYPHTPLARIVRGQGALGQNPNLYGTTDNNDDFLRPIFYVDAQVGKDIHAHVSSLVAGDRRFFHADPAQVDGNYNYNNNSVLANAIRTGERGAYWDILRRLTQT
jgi:radical SAM superfamily enzyme YgiQ (UPF0313 family)